MYFPDSLGVFRASVLDGEGKTREVWIELLVKFTNDVALFSNVLPDN